jgi:isopenicillin-N epimerase
MTDPLRGWALSRSVLYLNHGSFGACPEQVLALRERLTRELEANAMEFLVRRLPAMMMSQLAYAESLLGSEEGCCVFVRNATHGVNTFLASFPLGPGDEILVGSHEYFATRNACLFHAARSGASCRTVEMPFPVRDPGEVTGAFFEQVTPATRLVVIDHISSPTGFVLDIAPLVAELGRRGVEVLVDGAHGPGQVPLDLSALGAACYTGNFHKWLCSPKVSAVLYVRPDLRHLVHPLAVSHVEGDFRSGLPPYLVEFLWAGTTDPAPVLCVEASGRFLEGSLPGGLPAVMERNRALALEARELICSRLGLEPPCPDSMVGSMACVELPWSEPSDLPDWEWSDPLQKRLFESGIEVPVIYLRRARRRLLRISAQLYNSIGDYETLVREMLGGKV